MCLGNSGFVLIPCTTQLGEFFLSAWMLLCVKLATRAELLATHCVLAIAGTLLRLPLFLPQLLPQRVGWGRQETPAEQGAVISGYIPPWVIKLREC